jgi:hypothetical protein
MMRRCSMAPAIVCRSFLPRFRNHFAAPRSYVHARSACSDGRSFLRPLTKYTRVFPLGTVGLLMTDGHLLGFFLFWNRNVW